MKKRTKYILIASAVVIIGAVVAHFFFHSNHDEHETAQAEKGKKILYYRDPMDPSMTSDRPGKSPMGMDMVPVYEGEAGGGVKIDPTTVQNIGVRYEKVQMKMLSKTIRTVGKVDYDEKKLYYVNTKISGWVDKLLVNYTGKYVQKGEPLLEIYSPELVSAEEEYIIALKYKDANASQPDQKELFERAHRRLMYWDIPHEQVMRLEETREPEKTMSLVSPATGVVVEKNVLEGGSIMAGTNLYKIADLSTVWALAEVYEYEVPFIKVGQQATVTLAYDPTKVYKGRVSYIYPYLNNETRTVKVRIEISNPRGELKPEMFATVELQSPLKIHAIAIPEQSVIHSGERNVVVVSLGSGRFESRDVKLGVLAGGYYQVLEGVSEGEEIVVSSQFLLDSESNLKAAMQKMSHEGMEMDSSSMSQKVPGSSHEGMKMDEEMKMDGDMKMDEGMKMPASPSGRDRGTKMKHEKKEKPKQKSAHENHEMEMDNMKMDDMEMDNMEMNHTQMDSSSQHNDHKN